MARRTIFCRNVRQNTARIDRTVGNTAISRDFVRAVLSRVSTARGWLSTAVPSTDRLLTAWNPLFSRSFSWVMAAAVGAVGILVSFSDGL